MKADGCDLVAGLAESMKGVWTGDVDLNDGDLDNQYKEYTSRLLSIRNLQYSAERRSILAHDLREQFLKLQKDLEFLHQSEGIVLCQFSYR